MGAKQRSFLGGEEIVMLLKEEQLLHRSTENVFDGENTMTELFSASAVLHTALDVKKQC